MAIALILMLPWLLPTQVAFSSEILARNEKIAAAIDQAPWIINDRWSGRSVPIPVAASRILRPTAILSRRYRALELPDAADDLGGLEVTFVIVHCSDMRDMQGHHPPVCYPAQGWVAADEPPQQMSFESVTLGQAELTRYEFRLGGRYEDSRECAVLNLFIMPDGEVAADIGRLNSMKGRRAISAMGAAQVQLILNRSVDQDKSIRILRELVDGMPDLFSLLLGSEGESANDSVGH